MNFPNLDSTVLCPPGNAGILAGSGSTELAERPPEMARLPSGCLVRNMSKNGQHHAWPFLITLLLPPPTQAAIYFHWYLRIDDRALTIA